MNVISGNMKNKYEESLRNILDQTPVGILTFDSEFNVNNINQSFRKYNILYRLNFQHLEGSNLADNDILNIKSELSDLKTGIPFEKILQIPSSFGKRNIVLAVKAVPLFMENEFNGGILVIEDLNIAEKPEQEEILKSTDLEYALNHLNNFLFITDSAGVIRYSYGQELKKLPVPETGITGTSLPFLFPESVREKITGALWTAKEKRLPSRIIIELRIGKKLNTYECRVEPLVNDKGKVQHIFFVFNEISGYLGYASKLERENRELNTYKTLLDKGTDGIISINMEGNIIFWNKTAEEVFGATRDEVLNTYFGTISGISKDYFNTIKEKLSVSHNFHTTLDFTNRSGERKIIDAHFSLTPEGSILIICSDITGKTLSELELSRSEEKYRGIAVNTGAVIININPDGNIIYCNPAFIELTRFREEELLNKNLRDIINPGSFFPSPEALHEGKVSTVEISLTGRKGKVDIQACLNPVYNGNNNPIYYNIIGVDVTSFKKKEKDLEIFRSVFECSPDGMALESERNIIMVNEGFSSIFGFSSSGELINRDILDLISSSDILRAAEYFQSEQKQQEAARLEFTGRRKDGSTFSTEFTISTITSEERNYRIIIARDITDLKKAQQSIRESEEKYRNITDNIDDFLYTYENNGRALVPVFYTNSVEKVTGYNQSEFLKDSKLFLKIVHPDDFTVVKKKLKILIKSRLQLSEEFEFRIINKHGNIVWVRNKIIIVRTPERKIQKIYGLVSDISLRKKAEDELKISTSNLVKLNETKDKFISIISHDLRTPFTSILGFTDLLLNDEGLSEKEKNQYISFIRESSKSMLGLVNSLLDWTRLQTGRFKFEPNRYDASSIINACVNALSGAAYQKNIQLVSNVKKDLYVFVDTSLITQVFNNLISNAVKFTNKGGRIEISALPSEQLRFIEFIVKDNGVGISQDNLNKLFKVENKFTSEGTAGEKGSGLGLSLVKEIIEKHGGTITVTSTLSKGSEFHFTLPVAPATILLVDDSNTDRLLYSKILKNITPDYNIQLAANGREAMEIIKKSPPALVISDHVMPEMDGLKFVQTLLNSSLTGKPPVMILSSELDRHIIQDYTELGIEYVFQKPVNLIHFKQAVEKSLRKGLQG